jgi:hypothetical protein
VTYHEARQDDEEQFFVFGHHGIGPFRSFSFFSFFFFTLPAVYVLLL